MTEMDILKNPCLQFVVEDDFSYFCRYDDLSGIYSGISKEVPALADSCYMWASHSGGFSCCGAQAPRCVGFSR